MNKFKKTVSLVTILSLLSIGGVAFASGLQSPAELASELTGKTIVEVQEERSTGKTYGTMARDEGKLEEFKEKMLEQKKEKLNQRVKEEKMTQEQADKIYTEIKNNQATCDGTNAGKAKIGNKDGLGFGNGHAMGQGLKDGQGKQQGERKGQGFGQGQGKGQGNSQNLKR